MVLSYLSRADFETSVSKVKKAHGKGGASRWVYHEAAVSFLRQVAPTHPENVLEMGTMGFCVVQGSHTIDYAEKWKVKGFAPTYLHDARQLPWPIPDKRYEVFIALRVFHHLYPLQRECFLQARRIARNIIIVAPESYEVERLQDSSRGIPREAFTEWNDGIAPTATVEFKSWIGNLYFWNESALAGTEG